MSIREDELIDDLQKENDVLLKKIEEYTSKRATFGANMIYESSKDYGTGRILILYGEEPPTIDEIQNYVKTNYGILEMNIDIEAPTMFRGMMNLGTITVTPNDKLRGAL